MPPVTLWAFIKTWARDLRDALQPERRRRERLREAWGRPGDGEARFADRYRRLTGGDSRTEDLDAQTWDDLEFPRIFRYMDTTLTLPGRQVLFDQLHRLDTAADELADRLAICRRILADAPLRQTVRRTLARRLGHDRCLHLADYLFGDDAVEPHAASAWLAWSAAGIAVLGGMLAGYVPVWIWIMLLAANFVLLAKYHWEVTRDAEAMISCMALLDTADRLAARQHEAPDISLLARLAKRHPQRAAMRRALRPWILTKTEPASWIAVWFNLLFATEPTLRAFTMTRFARLRRAVAPDFTLVGKLDAAVAVAGFLQWQGSHCQPSFGTPHNIEIEAGRHPLLPNGQANTITLVHRSALVTGSNMAGKTTFIKMLAINAVLAQTLGFCLARRAVIPRARVLASIQNRHAVATGKSCYFAEIERIKTFLAFAAGEGSYILAIDEPFNGTNTTERIAIARSVLESLAEHAIVLATTHDIELQALLDGRFDFFHFREDPDVDGYFDYHLRPGTTRAHNAIRLLDELGFPAPVTGRAMAYAAGATS